MIHITEFENGIRESIRELRYSITNLDLSHRWQPSKLPTKGHVFLSIKVTCSAVEVERFGESGIEMPCSESCLINPVGLKTVSVNKNECDAVQNRLLPKNDFSAKTDNPVKNRP